MDDSVRPPTSGMRAGDSDGTAAALSVLLVESDSSIQPTAPLHLVSWPSKVLTAGTGSEALRIMGETRVDIVLADERLPDVPGTLLLGQIRKRYPETIRIVAARAATVEMTIDAINLAEVFRLLKKPCSRDEFLSCLQDAALEWDRRRSRPRPKSESSLLRELHMQELKRAFSRGLDALFICVQPVVSMSSRTVFAYEALVRTNEPQFPDASTFLEAAKRLARVRELERRIFAGIGELLPTMPATSTLFVNLHPQSLAERDLCADLAPLVPFAARVIFEITERSSLHDLDGAREQVERLRQLGFRIAVDDLGAGYAGLTSVALLQPDFVKIDMELVRGVDVSGTRAILIASVVALCGQLGIRVIAEGVETAAEKTRLLELGCDLLQGYYIAAPGLPFPDVAWPSVLSERR